MTNEEQGKIQDRVDHYKDGLSEICNASKMEYCVACGMTDKFMDMIETNAHQTEREEWVKINVGDQKEAEWHAIKSSDSEAFMSGFRYARNNLQRQKSTLLTELNKKI